jgi:hypothetical protein
MKKLLSVLVLLLSASAVPAAEPPPFDDPMFRRCIAWLLNGEGGALIGNVCLGDYDLPSPSLFICARKVRTGFTSETDRQACLIILEEEMKKVKAGYVK